MPSESMKGYVRRAIKYASGKSRVKKSFADTSDKNLGAQEKGVAAITSKALSKMSRMPGAPSVYAARAEAGERIGPFEFETSKAGKPTPVMVAEVQIETARSFRESNFKDGSF